MTLYSSSRLTSMAARTIMSFHRRAPPLRTRRVILARMAFTSIVLECVCPPSWCLRGLRLARSSGSNTGTPLDHTSILATLRDWLGIPVDKMLTSGRIAQAPTLEYVLTRTTPRTDKPQIEAPAASSPTPATLPPNDLQKSLITGTAARFGMDSRAVLSGIKTRQRAIDFFAQRPLAPKAQKGSIS